MDATTAQAGGALKRQLGVVDNILITVSAVTPASSIFVIAPFAIQQAGSGAFLSFALGGLLALAFAFCYAELGTSYQSAGGDYVIARQVFGGLSGYLIFMLAVVSGLFVPAVLASGIAPYLNTALGTQLPAAPVALVVVVVSFILGILNIRTNAWITGLFLLAEAAVLVLIAVIGFHNPHQSMSVLTSPQFLNGKVLAAAPLAAIATAVATAMFSYNGYAGAILLVEDMRNPTRDIARAVIGSLLVVLLIELIPLTAVILAAPSLTELIKSPDPIGYVIASLGSPTLTRVVAGSIFLSVFNAIVAMVIQTGRFLYASGRDQLWSGPLNRAFTSLHPRYESPWLATLFYMVPSAALTLLSNLSELTSFTVVLLLLDYLMIALAASVSRIRRTDVAHPWKMPLWPLWPLLALLGTGYSLFTVLQDSSTTDYLILGSMLLVSLTMYGLFTRRSLAFQNR